MITGYEVKPCPRCGAGQEHLHLRTEPPYMVRCGHCGLLGAEAGDSEAEAVAAWNATQAPATTEAVEAPKAPNNQQINRTSYYQLPCGLFLEDYIDYREMDFKWGSAVKYEYRAGAKDGEPEGKDRGKRNHYICEIAARDGVAHDAVLLQVRKYVAEAREWNPSPEVRKWYMPYPTDWRPSDEQAA